MDNDKPGGSEQKDISKPHESAQKSGKSTGPGQPADDLITRIIGPFGKYQLWMFCVVCYTKIFIAFHQMAIIFLAPKGSYKCGFNGTETCPCSDPVYDTSVFSETIIMKWDLICERKWLTAFNQTLFQFGVLVGSIFFGMASDRYGRKKPLLVAVVLQIVAGILAAFIPEYWTFTIVRFLIGMSVAGTMVTSFVIIMEFVSVKYRDSASALYQVPFNVGHMLLPLIGYIFRNIIGIQLAIAIPSALMLLYFKLVPETPRWLIAMKRTDEAVAILEHAAKFNKLPTENIKSEVEAFQASLGTQVKKGTLFDIFRTPNLRKNMIIMAFNWLACSYCFYGVSQFVGQLSGNAFINVFASATDTLVGTLLSIPLMRYLGRKTILIIFNLSCAFCLIILALVPHGTFSVVLACMGTVSSFIVFVVVYLYCSELFPTVVRNAALGFSSMAARVGSMVAPFVIDLRSVATWMPPIVFAVVPFIAGLATFLLPETKGCELTTTLEEGENFGKKRPTPAVKI